MFKKFLKFLEFLRKLLAMVPETPPVPPTEPPPVGTCPPGFVWSPTGGPHNTGGCIPIQPPVPPVEPPQPPTQQGCAKPDGIKLGWRDARKIQPGWRNMFNVTPTIGGVPAPEGCGQFYFDTYGEPKAEQSLEGGFQDDPVERASGDSWGCILVMATNSENLWKDGSYQEAGRMTVKVTYDWLPYWVAQDGEMGTDGLMRGFGTNSKSYQIKK